MYKIAGAVLVADIYVMAFQAPLSMASVITYLGEIFGVWCSLSHMLTMHSEGEIASKGPGAHDIEHLHHSRGSGAFCEVKHRLLPRPDAWKNT